MLSVAAGCIGDGKRFRCDVKSAELRAGPKASEQIAQMTMVKDRCRPLLQGIGRAMASRASRDISSAPLSRWSIRPNHLPVVPAGMCTSQGFADLSDSESGAVWA